MKISIITICYNSADYIEHTIKSVCGQTFRDKEYIVIDGCSTDGTIEIINKYIDKIDKLVSEPDCGIADAMNKGLALATGDYILFIHSDDYLMDENSLGNAVKYMVPDCDIFLFNIYLSDKGSVRLAIPRGLNWWMNFKTGVFHQSAFCSRSLFNNIGGFDTKLKIAMDYDFFLRAYRQRARVKYIPIPISVMRLTGISSRNDLPNLLERFKEEQSIHYRHCSNGFLRILYAIYWPLYLSYRKLLVLY